MLVSASVVGVGNALALSPLAEGAPRALANAALAAAALGLAAATRLSLAELGLTRRRLLPSVGVGSALGLVFALAVVLALGATRAVTGERIAYEPVQGLSAGELSLQLLIVFPLATAVPEEVIFRGLLVALWVRSAPDRIAIAASGVLFGAWHGVVLWQTIDDSGVPVAALAYAVSLVGLTVAGAALAVLQIRSHSLAAPIVAHWLSVGAIRVAARLM